MLLKGKGVSKGIAVGEVFLYKPLELRIDETYISPEQVEETIQKYHACRETARGELQLLQERMGEEQEEKKKIFDAHKDILYDIAMEEEIENLISREYSNLDHAVCRIYDKYSEILSQIEDELMKERCKDIQDVKNRLLRISQGKAQTSLSELKSPVILCAKDLLPSDTASLDREMVLAIATEAGGATSHSAILARSYGIPAVLGVTELMEQVNETETVIVDAANGVIITQPSDEEVSLYREECEKYQCTLEEMKTYRTMIPKTKDGERIKVGLNIGSANDEELGNAAFTDGVGLFRTEFLYMDREQMPGEEEQYQVYKKVLSAFSGKEVILRTLDIGGDKQASCVEMPKEENPFLGLRAIRLCFSRQELFKTQLKAAYRASIHGKLSIMFPMVAGLDDIRRAKAVAAEVKRELDEEKLPYSQDVRIGIMVEIPSIAIMAAEAAKEVDFASIGTNDLCQYLMAVDRLNPDVAAYYQTYHPAMFRLIGHVAEAFRREGKDVSVCGELGGDMLAVPVLLGLGIQKISMGMAVLGEVKKLISGLEMSECKKQGEQIVKFTTAQDAEQYLKKSRNYNDRR